MTKKLLVVNKLYPEGSSYVLSKSIGSYMLGRRLIDYAIFIVNENKEMTEVIPKSADIHEIQEQVLEAMKC